MSFKSTKDVGRMGETIACRYLKNKGFVIEARNFTKPWGEIDIVARRRNRLHFIEVKAGTGSTSYRLEEKVHSVKLLRLHRAIFSYLEQNAANQQPDWQIDIVAVWIDFGKKTANIRYIDNVILEQ